MPNRLLGFLLGVAILLTGSGLALAAEIDGRVDTDSSSSTYDNYGSLAYLDFNVEDKSETYSGAKLYFSQGTAGGVDYVDVAFVLPNADSTLADGTAAADLVDTTYGAGSSIHDSWGSRGHEFKDLKGSDKASIALKDSSGAIVLDVVMDYLDDDSGGWRANLGGDGSGSGNETWFVGSSSMVYNLGNYSGATTNSPTLDSQTAYGSTSAPLWEWEVIYEFRIKDHTLASGDDLFDVFTASAASIVLGRGDPDEKAENNFTIHVSPNKLGKNRVGILPPTTTIPPGSSAIPLPSGAWMGMAMLGVLGVFRRYRRRTV